MRVFQLQAFQVRGFIPVQSVLHILQLYSFLTLAGAQPALWGWSDPCSGSLGLTSHTQALPNAPAAGRGKGRVALFPLLDLQICNLAQLMPCRILSCAAAWLLSGYSLCI